MSDLRELYQQVILDHYKNPRNFSKLEGANRSAEGFNPLCGDKISLQLLIDDKDVVQKVGFQGSGCAISTASASIMTDCLKGKSIADLEVLFERFHDLVTGTVDDYTDLGKLSVFAGLRQYPVRVKCATLAWHTLLAALRKSTETVATE